MEDYKRNSNSDCLIYWKFFEIFLTFRNLYILIIYVDGGFSRITNWICENSWKINLI